MFEPRVQEYVDMYSTAISTSRSDLDDLVMESDKADVEEWLVSEKLVSVDSGWQVIGCSDIEIEKIRSAWNGSIPASIEAFYRLMGNSRGLIRTSTRFVYPSVLEAGLDFREWKKEMSMLKADFFQVYDIEIPEQAVHLGNHNGGIFDLFVAGSEDPEILVLDEGGAQPGPSLTNTNVTFSQRLIGSIAQVPKTAKRQIKSEESRRKYRSGLT